MTIPRFSAIALIGAVGTLALASCSKKSDGATDPTNTGSIALAAAPPSVTLVQGASTTIALAISRTNFTGAVSLTASGAPSGATVSFSESLTTASSVTITIATTAAATRGPATITITGVGNGVEHATAPIALTISGVPVSVAYCLRTPIWFGVQEGTGAWRQVLPVSAGQYAFDMSSATGGIAAVYQSTSGADGFSMSIFYGTVDQIREYGTSQCDFTGSKSVTVNVLKAAADAVDVGFGFSYFPGSPSRTTYPITSVPNGLVDLVASRRGATAASNRVVIRRGLDVPTGTVLPTIDFTAAATEGFMPETRSATVSGGQAGDALTFSGAYAPNVLLGSEFGLGVATLVSAGNFTFPVLPTTQLVQGDMHSASAFGLGLDYQYSATVLMHDPHNVALTLPATPAPVAITFAATVPHVRPRFTIARQADYGQDLNMFFLQSATGVSRSLSVEITGAYFGSAATDYTLPDFSTVAGFSTTWGLKTGLAASWQLVLEGRTVAQSGVSQRTIYIDGQQRRFGQRFGTVTP